MLYPRGPKQVSKANCFVFFARPLGRRGFACELAVPFDVHLRVRVLVAGNTERLFCARKVAGKESLQHVAPCEYGVPFTLVILFEQLSSWLQAPGGQIPGEQCVTHGLVVVRIENEHGFILTDRFIHAPGRFQSLGQALSGAHVRPSFNNTPKLTGLTFELLAQGPLPRGNYVPQRFDFPLQLKIHSIELIQQCVHIVGIQLKSALH